MAVGHFCLFLFAWHDKTITYDCIKEEGAYISYVTKSVQSEFLQSLSISAIIIPAGKQRSFSLSAFALMKVVRIEARLKSLEFCWKFLLHFSNSDNKKYTMLTGEAQHWQRWQYLHALDARSRFCAKFNTFAGIWCLFFARKISLVDRCTLPSNDFWCRPKLEPHRCCSVH